VAFVVLLKWSKGSEARALVVCVARGVPEIRSRGRLQIEEVNRLVLCRIDGGGRLAGCMSEAKLG